MKEVFPTLLSPTISTLYLFDLEAAPLELPAEMKTKTPPGHTLYFYFFMHYLSTVSYIPLRRID